jgi:hypothetical protein
MIYTYLQGVIINFRSGSSGSNISLVVELLATGGVVLEDLCGLELLALEVSVSVHAVHELLRALDVQHAEWTTHERREADAEHGSDITLAKINKQTIKM